MYDSATTWALAVGIEKYDREPLSWLRSATTDVTLAVNWLRGRGVPQDQIFLHLAPSESSSPDVSGLPYGDATKASIDASIARLRRAEGSRLFVFLCGHGLYEPTEGRLFLPQDAGVDDRWVNLALDRYFGLLRTLRFPWQFVFMDGSQTSPIPGSRTARFVGEGFPGVAEPAPDPSVALVSCFAAGPNEAAYERDGRSIFMRHLLAFLDSPPPDVVYEDPATGEVTVDFRRVFFNHLRPAVMKEATEVGRQVQNPQLDAQGAANSAERYPIEVISPARAVGEEPDVDRTVKTETTVAFSQAAGVDDKAAAQPVETSATPPSRTGGGFLAGYSSDRADETDLLNIDRDVNPLASLIASTEISPPLSIGLFGDWGAGKSFFMQQLQRRVARLAEAARKAKTDRPNQKRLYHTQVVQISFNAWHYAEANLWASLASRIFEGLADHLQDAASTTEAYRQVLELSIGLDHERALLKQAQDRRDALAARVPVGDGQPPEQQKLGQFAERHPELNEQVDALVDTIGAQATAASIREVVGEAHSLRGLATRVWRRWREVDNDRSTRLTKARLAGILAGTAMLGLFGLIWLVQKDAVAAVASFLVSMLSGAAAVANALLAKTRVALQAVEGAITAEQRQQLEAAEQQVAVHETQVEKLKAEIDALDPRERSSVYRFVRDRYNSGDYRNQLGIVAFIQRDLENLGRQLVGQQTQEQGEEQQTGAAVKSPLKLDRIVLYIDDLDRCPPKQVVQVLQAVHLLLAFPLFVVVVGVDPRWLLRSLQREYAAILSPDGTPDATDETSRYDVSTPQQYLEKIFQIPLALRPMQPRGFGQLVRGLLGTTDHVDNAPTQQPSAPLPVPPGGPAPNDAASTAPIDAAASGPSPPGTEPSAARPSTESAATTTAAAQPDAPAPVQPPSDTLPPTSSSAPTSPADQHIDIAPKTLEITKTERQFLESLGPLIPTPRAAKRLVNLYRLLKVSLNEQQMARFEPHGDEPGEHQAAALLLAIMIGFPAQAPELFHQIEIAPAISWPLFLKQLWPTKTAPGSHPWNSKLLGDLTDEQAAPWRQLQAALESVPHPHDLAEGEDLDPLKQWIGPVGRYSFNVGRFLEKE